MRVPVLVAAMLLTASFAKSATHDGYSGPEGKSELFSSFPVEIVSSKGSAGDWDEAPQRPWPTKPMAFLVPHNTLLSPQKELFQSDGTTLPDVLIGFKSTQTYSRALIFKQSRHKTSTLKKVPAPPGLILLLAALAMPAILRRREAHGSARSYTRF